MAASGHETEIKLRMESAAAARKLLRDGGFRLSKRRLFEGNVMFDTGACTLRASQKLLRVRETGGVVTVTYKGPPEVSKHKSREELEVDASSGEGITVILDRLGFQPVFRYEKYRAEYRKPGSRGVATVDETPIGCYMELEGAPDWIDRTARKLGFGEGEYITLSYGRLYLQWCEEHRVAPSNMVFARGK